MGCTNRKPSTVADIELKLEEFASHLQISKRKAGKIEGVSEEFSNLNEESIEKICENLGIEAKSDEYRFIKSFKCEGGRSFIYLNTVGVVFGKGSNLKKIKELFSIFDRENKGVLYLDDIRTMLKCLFEINVERFLEFIMYFMIGDCMRELRVYRGKLVKSKNLFISYFCGIIVDTDDYVDFNRFINKLEKEECSTLIDQKIFRLFAFSIYKSLEIEEGKNETKSRKNKHIEKITKMKEGSSNIDYNSY